MTPDKMTNAELADALQADYCTSGNEYNEAIKRLRAMPEPPKPETAIQYGEWTIFNGGPCPLKEGERAQVQTKGVSRLHAETTLPGVCSDKSIFEVSQSHDCAVIAFRRVIEPKRVTAIGHVHLFGEAGMSIYHGAAGRGVDGCRDFTLTITGDTIEAEWA